MPVKVKKIIKVLEAEEGLISGEFQTNKQRVCNHAGRCALGALIVAMPGVTPRQLTDVQDTDFGPVYFFAKQLYKEYGLRREDCDEIIQMNDSIGSWDTASQTYYAAAMAAYRNRCQRVIELIKGRWGKQR